MEWGNLSRAQVNVAVGYYADFPDEVDERIANNREEAERQHAAWLPNREGSAAREAAAR